MIEGAESVSGRDLVRIAGLHRQVMPLSVLGRMGDRTLRRYYAWVTRSDREHLFVERDGETLMGVAVLSEEPAKVISRFVWSAPVSFAASALAAFLRLPAFRRDVREFIAGDGAGGDYAPEVLQIFVAPEYQARHAGTRLLARVEEWLRQRHVGRYYVRTLANGNMRTLTFYQHRGFREIGTRAFCGVPFVIMEKVVE